VPARPPRSVAYSVLPSRPRDTIRERIWGVDDSYGSNTLDVYIGYLRRKTESGGEARMIHTLRGVGFVLRAP
jgi:two-component system, OmpR family, response regulator MprA